MIMEDSLYETAYRWTPAWLRELARTAGSRVGCQIGRLPSVELLGTHLVELFQQLRINCVLDVGAHVGQYGRFLRNIGYTGHIVSFEPISANFAQLRRISAGDPNWQAINIALGDEAGTVPINVARITQFSSFLSPSSYSLSEFSGYSDVDRVEMVERKRLDEVFAAAVAPVRDPRVFLKLDTQGYDLNIVEGASGCLRCIRGLQSELSVKPLYDGITDYLSAIAFLKGKGFELTGMFPVTRDPRLRIMEFDCVMIASPAESPATSR
jgi:FkbM family methyltransferase